MASGFYLVKFLVPFAEKTAYFLSSPRSHGDFEPIGSLVVTWWANRRSVAQAATPMVTRVGFLSGQLYLGEVHTVFVGKSAHVALLPTRCTDI